MTKLTIDNREIKTENGETILQAARANGIAIPTLCYHAALEPYAACRLCIVELTSARGKLVAACAQRCEDGMNVLTNSERVQAARRVTAELLMASGAHLPTVQAIARAAGVERVRYSLPPNDCILCGLCVRACDELVGAHAISLVERGLEKKFAPPFEITSAACIGCATCVLICPTGAIKFEHITPPSTLGKGGANRRGRLIDALDRDSRDVTIREGGLGGIGHDARTCRLCGEASLHNQFVDVDALFKEEVLPA